MEEKKIKIQAPRIWLEEAKRMLAAKEVISIDYESELLWYRDGSVRDLVWAGFPNCIELKPTGMKDKNGEDVYEGDVLSNGCGELREVVRNRGRWAYPHSYAGEVKYYGLMSPLGRMWFVAGNKFENPELLEGSNEI